MSISKTKRNFIMLLTLFTIICGGVGMLILHFNLPEHYFKWFPYIPIFFYVMGIASIYAFDSCRSHAPNKTGLLYMALKVVKLILSVVLLLVYCIIVKEHEKDFILSFVAYYLSYLIFETWFFFSYEKKKTKIKKQNETVS